MCPKADWRYVVVDFATDLLSKSVRSSLLESFVKCQGKAAAQAAKASVVTDSNAAAPPVRAE